MVKVGVHQQKRVAVDAPLRLDVPLARGWFLPAVPAAPARDGATVSRCCRGAAVRLASWRLRAGTRRRPRERPRLQATTRHRCDAAALTVSNWMGLSLDFRQRESLPPKTTLFPAAARPPAAAGRRGRRHARSDDSSATLPQRPPTQITPPGCCRGAARVLPGCCQGAARVLPGCS